MNDYKNKITSLNLKSKPIFEFEDHLKYTKDWRGQYIGDAIAIVKPHDKYEVSKILKFFPLVTLVKLPNSIPYRISGLSEPYFSIAS